jgi:hypothetical protein
MEFPIPAWILLQLPLAFFVLKTARKRQALIILVCLTLATLILSPVIGF